VLVTAVVVIVKVAEVAPAGTVTVAGTVAAELLDERFTTEPPVGAAFESVTVPVVLLPPTITFGLIERPERIVGCRARVAESERPGTDAVIVALVSAATNGVVIVKLADVAPAGTVTLVGTVAPLALSVTATPPVPAG
jgi:hypothetical protein